MAMSFADFGAACEKALNPNSNGLNQSIADTNAAFAASIAETKKNIEATNANTANYLNQQNQQVQNSLKKSNQDVANAFSIASINGAIKDAGSLLKTGTGEMTDIASGNL